MLIKLINPLSYMINELECFKIMNIIVGELQIHETFGIFNLFTTIENINQLSIKSFFIK